MKFRWTMPLAGLLIAADLTGCRDTTGINRVPLKLSFSTSSLNALALGPVAFRLASDLSVGTTGELTITKVQVVVDGVELSHTDGVDCNASAELQCEAMETAPELVEIPLTSGVETLLTVPVPEGTYERVDARIGLPSADDPRAATFFAAHPEFREKTVRVEGSYRAGTTTIPFVYTTFVESNLELQFTPPAVVTANSRNITVAVDVASWFRDSTGAALDPSDPANSAIIDANILNSFSVFGDDNLDGIRD